MFYEAVCDGKGRIEVVRLNDDCTVSEPYIALERDYHLSYPFVFRYNCEWYMIPESCAADNVQLFKAKSFPFEWEYVAAILEKHAVDTTVAEIDGKLLMLTFLPQAGTENVYPEAYWLTLNKDGTHDIQKLNWMEYDTLVVRGAGKMIKWDNSVVIRPVQINRENSYGDGVAFCRVVIGGNAYSEKRISALLPENVRIKKYRADGLHTYAVSRKFEVIDVRCQLSDPFKIWRKLRGRK